MKAAGKVIVVTGAGAGMGREVTLELLRRGAKAVVAVDVNEDALNETVTLAGADGKKVNAYIVDITDLAKVKALATKVLKKHGEVDGLINVAGIIHKFLRVNDLDMDAIHRVFNVNLFGTIHMVKTFLPELLKRPEAQITNISSMGSYVPVPGQTMYGASKAAIKLFTEGLRSELAGTNVGANLVFPGAVSTNIAGNSGAFTAAEMKKMTSSPEAAKHKTLSPAAAGSIIVDGFESNKYHVFAGSDASTMFKLSRLVPEKAAQIIQKNMASLLK